MLDTLEIALYPSGLELTPIGALLRLLCALLLGIVIGTEREYTNRPAGMRTHMLVSLGACVVMIIGQLIYLQYAPYGDAPDPARLGAQVISGIGFLGAGTILREGLNVKGLTTAASLWATACLGLAAGAGYYAIAICGGVFILATLTIFEFIQHRMFRSHKTAMDYTLTTSDQTVGLRTIRECAQVHKALISDVHIRRHVSADCYTISFSAIFTGSGAGKRPELLLADLAAADCITSVETSGPLTGVPVK